jgi:hypothetical protein
VEKAEWEEEEEEVEEKQKGGGVGGDQTGAVGREK